AQGVRFLGARGDFPKVLPAGLDRLPVHEPPDVTVERAELLLHVEERARVRHGGFDLEAVSNDPGVVHEPCPPTRIESCHAGRIESGEGLSIVLPFAKDGAPGEPGLRALQGQELEEAEVIVHRHAPLFIVVAPHQWVRSGPGARALYRPAPCPCRMQGRSGRAIVATNSETTGQYASGLSSQGKWPASSITSRRPQPPGSASMISRAAATGVAGSRAPTHTSTGQSMRRNWSRALNRVRS